MAIKETIEADLKVALKNREALKTSILRLLLSDIHNFEIQKRGPLEDSDILSVLSGAVKKHKDSIAQFQTGGRLDLAGREEAELRIIQTYLPEELSASAVSDLVRQVITEVQPKDEKDFGKVMQKLMPRLKGRADGSLVSKLVREELQKNAP